MENKNTLEQIFDDLIVMAVPQEDGKDTELLLKYGEHSPLIPTERLREGEYGIFGGRVALRHYYQPLLQEFNNAPFDHPNIGAAEALIESWPEIYDQCGEVLNAFHPVLIKGVEDDGTYKGSNSHQPKDTLGSMWATVHDPVLLAQAIVHELAHNKLFAIGQYFGTSEPFFENDQKELYDSPIRLDVLRPMSAVFHAVYAFVHVLALDRKMLRLKLSDQEHRQVRGLLHYNALRMRKGAELIEKCARLTKQGECFVATFLTWAHDEITQALEICNSTKRAGPLAIIGPSGSGKTKIAKRLGLLSGIPVVSLDEICWDVWWDTSLIKNKLIKIFGSKELIIAIIRSESFCKTELMKNWIKQGFISTPELEVLNLQLAYYALNKFPNTIIDFGAGHCVINDRNRLQHLSDFFCKADANIVLIRPLLDLETTIQRLTQRVGHHDQQDHENVVRSQLESPAYRTLAHYVIDTDSHSEEECCQKLIKLGVLPET